MYYQVLALRHWKTLIYVLRIYFSKDFTCLWPFEHINNPECFLRTNNVYYLWVGFFFFVCFFSSDLISNPFHLCSRSARAGRWCWSATTVARAPRKEPSLITAGWETAGEAWWLLPGKPCVQTRDKMETVRAPCSPPSKMHVFCPQSFFLWAEPDCTDHQQLHGQQ